MPLLLIKSFVELLGNGNHILFYVPDDSFCKAKKRIIKKIFFLSAGNVKELRKM